MPKKPSPAAAGKSPKLVDSKSAKSPARTPETKSVTAAQVTRALESAGKPEAAAIAMRFFKTGEGEYGEADVFRGIKVPDLRRMARDWKSLPLEEVVRLLHSRFHEDRFVALVLMVERYRVASRKSKPDPVAQKQLFELYLANVPAHINNWDLIDTSAPHIVGAHLATQPLSARKILDQLAADKSIWRRRVSMLATQHFIREGDFADALRIANRLVSDSEDLIHKAVGWMVREIGERDLGPLRAFLDKHAATMPRTMLRYALEKLAPAERKKYMSAATD